MRWIFYLAEAPIMFPQPGDPEAQDWIGLILVLLVFVAILYIFLKGLEMMGQQKQGKMLHAVKKGEHVMPSGNEETEARSEIKLIGISLLPGEKIITDIQQGLLSKGFDITARNNIILTNRRLIIRLKRFMSSLQTYYVELDKITVMNIDTQLNWPRAAVSYLGSLGVLFLFGIVFEKDLKHADPDHLLPLVLVLLPFIIAIGELYLSKKVGINIAIPGFSEVNMGRSRGGGLFFQLRGGFGIHSSKLQEFIDQVYLQKQLLEGTRGEKYSKATPVPLSTSGTSAQNRISDLKDLYESGDISTEEYETLRRKILNEI